MERINISSSITSGDKDNLDTDYKTSLKTCLEVIGDRIKFFEEEVDRNNAILSTLIDILTLTTATKTLTKLQLMASTEELSTNSITLSHAFRLRKQKNYLSKMKICTKMYRTLNEKLTNDIKFVKRELEESTAKVDNVLKLSPEQVNIMEDKLRRYENELKKFEKKYPWLNDSEIDLPSLSREIKTLDHLRNEKEKLIEKLNYYQGLKPDLDEAIRQVAEIKLNYQEINQKLLNSGK